MRTNSEIINSEYIIVFILWLVLTTININKAFHIDDTFHLEAAEYIKDNSTKPLSGLINWGDIPTPMYTHNQPPLFFYLLSISISIFGTNEIALHLLISIFTFLSLFFFLKISKELNIKNIQMFLVFFALSPAFIVNQNLMTDVPILALVLGIAYFLIRAKSSNKFISYCIAALLLGLGLLIKYSILPLLVVFILILLLRKDYKSLPIILIPLALLFFWSMWNYFEYDSIHILDRPTGVIHINKFWSFMACLGSMSTFAISLYYGMWKSKNVKRFFYFFLIIFLISIILFIFNLIPENIYSDYLNWVFVTIGLLLNITLIIIFVQYIRRDSLHEFLLSDLFVIFLFLGSISIFFILLAPFIATRHILLIIPFILLSGHEIINNATKKINRLSLILTIVLGTLLGISDWVYADFYRKMASSIEIPQAKHIWTVGHWGWGWYAKENGLLEYSLNESKITQGDYFVYPGDISKQEISNNIDLILVDKIWEEANCLTFFSGNSFASMYNSSIDKTPWCLSKNPIDTIFIYRVENDIITGPQLKEINSYKSKK